jgi:hypothetical protein
MLQIDVEYTTVFKELEGSHFWYHAFEPSKSMVRWTTDKLMNVTQKRASLGPLIKLSPADRRPQTTYHDKLHNLNYTF